MVIDVQLNPKLIKLVVIYIFTNYDHYHVNL
jgi:hypothetical protein